jgi:hypothetical protein
VSVYLAVVGIEHGIRFFVEAREQEIQNARLSAQLSSARFAAPSAQLNPHFLFNTLNTIAVLVRDGERTAAARIVEQLSDVLRRTLSRHRANEVTLDEELELVEQARTPAGPVQRSCFTRSRTTDAARHDRDVAHTISRHADGARACRRC